MKCPKCFNEIANNNKICPICGNIFATYFEEIKLTKKQKIKLILHRILFPLVITTVIVGIIVLITINQKRKMERITDVNELIKDETSVNYINDLYISDGRHYEYLLNKTEKEIYNILLDAIKKHEETIKIDKEKYKISESKFKTETIKKIKDVLTMDHPELIQVGNINYGIELNQVTIKVDYIMNEEQYLKAIDEMKNKIEELKIEDNELEVVKNVYNHLYDTELIQKHEISNAYECLVQKKCNDKGYAKAIQIIFNNLKINSMIAIGTINHKHYEWNIVKVDNKYYYYDQTLAKENEDFSYKGLLFNDKKYELNYKSLMPTISKKVLKRR